MSRTTKDKERPAEKRPLKLLGKVLSRDNDWLKDELEEALHWFRQFQALIVGIIFGLVPVRGLVGNVAFCLINVVFPLGFVTGFLGCDEEDAGGRWDIIKEGFPVAYGSFLFYWVMTYTLFQT